MKKILLLLLAVPLLTHGQEGVADTAAQVVGAYLRSMNCDALRSDSILYIESKIAVRGSGDTVTMRRWFGTGNRMRIEIWHRGRLERCQYSAGRQIFHSYTSNEGKWKIVARDTYYDITQPYRFSGPLYRWEMQGEELTYLGGGLFEGRPIDRVEARNGNHYDRTYYFDRGSHRLFLYTESNRVNGEDMTSEGKLRVDWHMYHEYISIGGMLLPRSESYQHQGEITLIFHTPRYIATDQRLFTQDGEARQ